MAEPAPAPPVLRPLEAGDFAKGFMDLLAQLTVVGECDEAAFLERLAELQARPETYRVLVLEDAARARIVGAATLLIELKFIRGRARCGHVEDVVVDAACRGQRLGLRLVEACVAEAKAAGCYKVILDCSEANAGFYARAGLERKEIQMVKYLDV